MARIYANRIYEPVFHTKSRLIDIWGGRGRGGSHFGTDYFLHLITQKKYFRGYFVRQVFSDIRESLFRDFIDRISENDSVRLKDFLINESAMKIVYKPTGNMIFSKGVKKEGSRTAKMKSIAGATHVLIEEADELGEEDFDQLDISLRTIKVENIQILRVFNPPSKFHWIWRDYTLTDSEIQGYFKATPKADSDMISIFSTYHANRENLNESTITKLEGFKINNPEYYNNQVLGLISEGAKGRIFHGWNSITYKRFTEINSRTIYCLDFGYSGDPNALTAIKKENRHLYVHELLYQTGLDNLQLAKRLCDLGITKADLIVGDPGGGGDLRLAELRRGFVGIEGYPQLAHGFNVVAAYKPPGSVNWGIADIQGHEVFMTEESSNGWHEYREYKWAIDRDKNPTDAPVDKDNHIMDTIRYFLSRKGREY